MTFVTARILALVTMLGGWACAMAQGAAHDVWPVGAFSRAEPEQAMPAGWEPLTFEKIPRHTRYAIVMDGDVPVLKAVARGSASGLIRRVRIDPREYPVVEWRWKVENLIFGADPRTKEGDDFPARFYVAFAYDPKRAGPLEAIAYEAAKLAYGQYPPYRSLNYVWDARLPAGTGFPSAYTERNWVIVVESGAARLGQWVRVRRNVAEDYRRAFGTEPPPIEGIGVMTDGDNTGGAVTAYYGDIVFHKGALRAGETPTAVH